MYIYLFFWSRMEGQSLTLCWLRWTKPAQERGRYQKPEGPFTDVHVLDNVLKHIRRNSELPESQHIHVPFQSSTPTLSVSRVLHLPRLHPRAAHRH
jgi:hypothetical protein